MNQKPTFKTAVLCLFILLKSILQYILINPVYELHRDEYLHLDQAHHLAWGYISVPPFTSWISYIIFTLGNSVFWVKFFPALFGVLTLIIVWKAIESLGGNLYALILGAVCITFSSLLRFNMLYQPNSFDILCWTAIYFCLVKYFKEKSNHWLFFTALVFSFGFLNKYNILFAVAGLLPALLISPQRKIFANPILYYSILLGLVLVSPNLYWQYANGFPVIQHMKELADTQLVNVNRADFLKEQLLFFTGSILVLFAGFIALFIYKPFRNFRFLFWALVFSISLFTYLKAKNYYAVGLYPIFFAFGAVFLEHLLRKKWLYYLRPVMVLIPILALFPFINIAFPVRTPDAISRDPGMMKKMGILRWEDGKDHPLPQDFADMLGWKELAAITDSAYAAIEDKDNTLVLCDNYGQAGAINYYASFKNINALSLNADYVHWFPENKIWKNLILVKTIGDDDENRNKERPYFDTVYFAGHITNQFAREKGTAVYVLLDAKPVVQKIIKKEIEDNK